MRWAEIYIWSFWNEFWYMTQWTLQTLHHSFQAYDFHYLTIYILQVGGEILRIEGPICTWDCCCEVRFNLYRADDEDEVKVIGAVWTPKLTLKEYSTFRLGRSPKSGPGWEKRCSPMQTTSVSASPKILISRCYSSSPKNLFLKKCCLKSLVAATSFCWKSFSRWSCPCWPPPSSSTSCTSRSPRRASID